MPHFEIHTKRLYFDRDVLAEDPGRAELISAIVVVIFLALRLLE